MHVLRLRISCMADTKSKAKGIRSAMDDYAFVDARRFQSGTTDQQDGKHGILKPAAGRSTSASVLTVPSGHKAHHGTDERTKKSSLGVERPSPRSASSASSTGHLSGSTLSTQGLTNSRKSSDPRHDSPKIHLEGPASDHVFAEAIQKMIIRAKAEGKTISLLDGRLFIDYRYVAPLPDGCQI